MAIKQVEKWKHSISMSPECNVQIFFSFIRCFCARVKRFKSCWNRLLLLWTHFSWDWMLATSGEALCALLELICCSISPPPKKNLGCALHEHAIQDLKRGSQVWMMVSLLWKPPPGSSWNAPLTIPQSFSFVNYELGVCVQTPFLPESQERLGL